MMPAPKGFNQGLYQKGRSWKVADQKKLEPTKDDLRRMLSSAVSNTANGGSLPKGVSECQPSPITSISAKPPRPF